MVACGSVGKTCGISCFSRYRIFLQVHKEGGVCNQGGFWACLLGRILCINLPIWTGVYNFLKVMRCDWDGLWHRKTSAWGGVLSVECQAYKRVCHWLHLSPSGEQSDMKQLREKGGKISLRGLEQLTVFIIPASCTPPATASVFGTSLWGWCYLAVRRYAILASLEGFDAWCETK